jgi:carbon-monoxide dehydrogenase small subunit
MLMIARDMIRRHDRLDEATVREGLAGHICRCTGYVGIVDAILDAHASLSDRHADSQADNQAGDRAGDRADHHHETRRAG